MIEYRVFHISNGAWLTSGSRQSCEEYCQKYGYKFVKAIGWDGEDWYVE